MQVGRRGIKIVVITEKMASTGPVQLDGRMYLWSKVAVEAPWALIKSGSLRQDLNI